MPDVHTRHCCKYHGCKYNDLDCTVTTGKEPQEYDCETCDYIKENHEYMLIDLHQYYCRKYDKNLLSEVEKELFTCILKVMITK